MDQNLLVNELVKMGSRFLEEFDKRYPIAVAFWMKEKDDIEWRLHIASDKIGDAKREVYGEVRRVAETMKDIGFDSSYVRLETMDERIIQWALDRQRRNPGPRVIFDVPGFYGEEVEGMYLYPTVKTAIA
jgi:hypothetical protein